MQRGRSGSRSGRNEFGNLPHVRDAVGRRTAKCVRRGHLIEEVRSLPDRPAMTTCPVWGTKPQERRRVVLVFTGKCPFRRKEPPLSNLPKGLAGELQPACNYEEAIPREELP